MSDKPTRAAQKAGRGALWLTIPVVGFLRSREAGRRRQADLIADKLNPKPPTDRKLRQQELQNRWEGKDENGETALDRAKREQRRQK